MAKTKEKSRVQRATTYVRNKTDRERNLYVAVRKALAPRTAAKRSRIARESAAEAAFEIPAEKGFAIFPPGHFPEADAVVQDATARYQRVGEAGLERDPKRKQFMIPIVERSEITRESPIMRLALNEDVLGATSGYLGTAPLLTNLNVYVSKSSSRELMSSQLLHCDADDTRQIKVFVLCSEVTEANGPLMIMDAATSRALREKVGYEYRNRVTDEQAREALGEVELTPLMGPAGTVCLVDTSRCFHYGSRVSEKAAPRVAAMAQFLTPFSFMLSRKVVAEAPFRGLVTPQDGAIRQLALGGS